MGEKKKQASAYREPLILIAFVILGAIIGMVMGEKRHSCIQLARSG